LKQEITTALIAITLGFCSVAQAREPALLNAAAGVLPSAAGYALILMKATCKLKKSSRPIEATHDPAQTIEIEISNYKFSLTYFDNPPRPGDIIINKPTVNGKKYSPPAPEPKSYFRLEPLPDKLKKEEIFQDNKTGKFGMFALETAQYTETGYLLNPKEYDFYHLRPWLGGPLPYEEQPNIYDPVEYTYDCLPK
jgi:hypothetical protein